MALNSSGPLGLGGATAGQSVNLELGKAATAFITMNDTDLRTLFGVASGPVSMSTGYGKSSWTAESTRGYFGGGAGYPAVTYFNTVDRLEFSTEALTNIGAVLPNVLLNANGVNNTARGYYIGGLHTQPGVYSNEVIGVQFSTETGINPAVVLAGAAGSNRANHQSSARGYLLGGLTPTFSTEIAALQFSDESTIDTAAALLVARYGHAGVNSSTRGYVGAGYSTVFLNDIEALNFSTETVLDTAGALAVARRYVGAVNSTTRGYFGAGGIAPAGSVEIDGLEFASETGINPAAGLVQSRYVITATTNSSARGYFGGGIRGPLNYNQLDGIIFASESTIDPAAGLTAFSSDAGVNNSNH